MERALGGHCRWRTGFLMFLLCGAHLSTQAQQQDAAQEEGTLVTLPEMLLLRARSFNGTDTLLRLLPSSAGSSGGVMNLTGVDWLLPPREVPALTGTLHIAGAGGPASTVVDTGSRRAITVRLLSA
jgi:hypothetical protein